MVSKMWAFLLRMIPFVYVGHVFLTIASHFPLTRSALPLSADFSGTQQSLRFSLPQGFSALAPLTFGDT